VVNSRDKQFYYLCIHLKVKKNISFHTLGCKLNFSETSTLRRQFSEEEYNVQKSKEDLDVYVLNTCSVTNNANKEARQIVRKVKRANPNATVVVTGCYAQLKPEEIAEIDGVDLVIGAQEKFNLKKHLDQYDRDGLSKICSCDIDTVEDFHTSHSINDRTRTFLKVQDGCDYNCSFCTIPMARGKSRSDTIENVLNNLEELSKGGTQEVILTGVNLGDFGKGMSEKHTESFFELAKAIDQQAAIPRYRISSIEPNLLSEEIIELVAQSKCFMPHFHIPLQSGSPEILGKMRRRYRRDLYRNRIELIKKRMPHCSIGVDVIVGFPGETNEHFQETHDFLHELDVSYLHVFTYSERENTLANEMRPIIPNRTRDERNAILRNLSDKKLNHFREQFKGKKRPTLFEHENKDGKMYGYTDNYLRMSTSFEEILVNKVVDWTV